MSRKGKLERGSYRGILVTILDGPDFRALDPAHRWLLVALKMTLGPCQIASVDAIDHIMVGKTGHPLRVVRAGLAILESAGWIKREKNVIWVVEGLKFEPSFDASDPKHRKAVHRFVASLPRLAIVAEFRQHYADYFVDENPPSIEGPSHGPTEGPSDVVGSTEDRRPKTETETELVGGREIAIPQVRLARAVNRALLHVFGEDLQPLLPTSQGATALLEVVHEHAIPVEFAETCLHAAALRCREKPKTLAYFKPGLVRDWLQSQAKGDAKSGADISAPAPRARASRREESNAAVLSDYLARKSKPEPTGTHGVS